jgi:hypothetical protein
MNVCERWSGRWAVGHDRDRWPWLVARSKMASKIGYLLTIFTHIHSYWNELLLKYGWPNGSQIE